VWRPDLLCRIKIMMRLSIAKLPCLNCIAGQSFARVQTKHLDKPREKRITGFSLSLGWVTMVCTKLSVLESISYILYSAS